MTKIVNSSPNDISQEHLRYKIRHLSQDEFISQYGSGTLRKSAKLGFNIYETYLQERARFEFGQGFECVVRSRVTYSDIKLVPSKSLTELGWHAERMIEMTPFASDTFLCKQFEVEYADNKVKEGAGILVWETSAPWIPQGYTILSIVSVRKDGKYLDAINPF